MTLAGLALAAAVSLGAAPAAPSYYEVQQSIARVRAAWDKPGARPQPNAPGWNAFFDAMLGQLQAYTAATDEDGRLRALGQLYQMSVSLQGINWAPANEVRDGLRNWLRPRVRLAWAERRLVETVRGLPTTADAGVRRNRDRWVDFVGDDLGEALKDYEGAPTVQARQASLKRLYGALDQLDSGNKAHSWGPSGELEAALHDLYNHPNFEATADANSLAPFLEQAVVQPGWIYWKDQWTYVTPGPITGFGLMACNDGIAFFNRQLSTNVTPIRGFNQQVSSDPQGQRATKLYSFAATSRDDSEITIIGIIRPSGLSLVPQQSHNVNVTVASAPTEGHGLGRAIAAMVGFNRGRITEQVREGAVRQLQLQVPESARELANIKTNEAAAQQNARLRNVLVGNDTARFKNAEIDGLTLRSQPSYAIVAGRLKWAGAAEQVGADLPQPGRLATVQPGVVADVHLPSLFTNVGRGYIQSPAVQGVENLMFVTRKVPPGAPPGQGIAVTRNVDFATFSKVVETARAANDPKVLAVRIKRPGRVPEFGADARGFLVAIVHDFALEVPAPPQAARGFLGGPPATIYRFSSPDAEIAISFKFTPASGNAPAHLSGRIEDVDLGPRATVEAINDDESKAADIQGFGRGALLLGFATKLRGQPIDLPLSNLNIPRFAITDVSPLDPSGWARVVLQRTQ
jgi:hypothetical protein